MAVNSIFFASRDATLTS